MSVPLSFLHDLGCCRRYRGAAELQEPPVIRRTKCGNGYQHGREHGEGQRRGGVGSVGGASLALRRVPGRRSAQPTLMVEGYGQLACASVLSPEPRRSELIRMLPYSKAAERDGALMEQSGRHRWQPVANAGKEGVDGSSPSEGFRKFLLISSFRRLVRRQKRDAASTERPRRGANVERECSKQACGLPLPLLGATSTQRPRPFERKRVEERDGVLAAVVGQVAVVAVDHRDARAHEAGDGEHRDYRAQRERRARCGAGRRGHAAARFRRAVGPASSARRPKLNHTTGHGLATSCAEVRRHSL